MRPSRSSRRNVIWLCLMALVMGALLPVIARGLVFGVQRAAELEVCTTTGMVMVHAVEPGADGSGGGDALRDGQHPGIQLHCAYCALHGGSLGLPPADPAAVPADTPAHVSPVGDAVAFTVSFWLTARSRAPPSLA